MSDILDDIFEDAEQAPVPTVEQLSEIETLARDMFKKELELHILEEQVKTKTAEINEIRGKKLPDLMKTLRMMEFKLEGGYKVERETEYYAHITKDRKKDAFSWLRTKGHGDLIKNEITVSLGRGEDEKVAEIEESLTELGVPFDREENIHHSTLKAFVKEQIQKGQDIPHETFGVHVQDVAKITAPKQPRPKRTK